VVDVGRVSVVVRVVVGDVVPNRRRGDFGGDARAFEARLHRRPERAAEVKVKLSLMPVVIGVLAYVNIENHFE
jgi:hypothetical protein